MAKKKVKLIEFLIDEVQNYPCIWNKVSMEYKNIFRKTNSWDIILKNMKSHFPNDILIATKMDTVDGMKSQWRAQRDKFSKIKRDIKSQTRSGAGLADVQGIDWHFYQKASTTNIVETWIMLFYLLANHLSDAKSVIPSWYGRPNPEDQINTKLKDRIFDWRTE